MVGQSACCCWCYHYLDQPKWAMSIINTTPTMQPFMLHWVQYHGVRYLPGSYIRRILDTQVRFSNLFSRCKNFLNNLWIFPIFQKCAGFVSDILSCRVFLITTRISYGVYLTQFPIFFYNVGTTRHAGYYNLIPTMVNILSMSTSGS